MAVHNVFHRTYSTENKLRRETLEGIQTSGDRGQSIWSHTLIIIKDNKIIADNEKSGDSKLVARYKEIVANSKMTIRENMTKLGADEACINEMMNFIDNGDADGAREHLLKLLMKRNPGLYRRKMAACQVAVKQK